MHDLILANFAKHIALNAAETDFVLSLLKRRTLRKKDVLLFAGDVCAAMSFVSSGCLRIFHQDANGKEHILLFAPEDWWAVDTLSFYQQTPAFYTIDALEDTEVLQLGFDDLENLYARVPKFERFFRILSQNGFILYQRRIVSNLSEPAEARYARFKKLYPNLSRRIAQKHIASYLGITPEFLSQLRQKTKYNS